jgi:hypothetical protein
MHILQKQFSKIQIQTIVLILFSIVFLLLGLPSLYKRIMIWSDGYALGDWLINYEDGGFKRRGLSGSLFITLARFSGIYVGKIVLAFISLLYFIFILLFIKVGRTIKFDFTLILFCCLPTVFLFPLNDFFAFGRKEIILFIIFLFFIDAYYKRDIYSWKFILILSSLLTIATLFHELIVFYVPYLMLIYLFNYLTEKKGNLLKIAVIGASAFIPAFIIFTIGKDINEGNSWTIFKNLGIAENVMKGIFDWPKEGFGKGKVNALTFAKERNYELYAISYIITLIVFFSVLFKQPKFKIPFVKIGLIHLALLTLSFPMFYLTIDWGRWINIHYVCMAFMLILFYEKLNPLETMSIKTFISNNLSFRNLIKSFIFLLLVFGFSMDHVEIGFKLGQNDFLIALRDIFWNIRHLNF